MPPVSHRPSVRTGRVRRACPTGASSGIITDRSVGKARSRAFERTTMSEAYLVGGVRTPVGRYGGALADVRPDDLAAMVVRAAVERAAVEPGAIDEVYLGAANQAGEDNRNVARMAVLLAGLPDDVPGLTVNRLCASGMSAVALAANAVRAGDMDVIVAGGVESMTRAPWVQAKPSRAWAKPGDAYDTSIGWRFTNPAMAARDKATFSMPETAEEVGRVDGITREDADEFALRSHMRAIAAIDAGRLAPEIVPVPTARGAVVDTDEGPRRETSIGALAKLRPVVAGGSVVTAGNSSSLNDGASALVVASAAAVERHGLRPRARIVSAASAALAPEIMGLGPVPATRKALEKAGLQVGDLGAVELNEAFATQSIASIRRLGLDHEIVNADGGAIALGHPLGSSGSRLLVTLLGRLERERTRFGLATMCVGVGQGTAMIVERIDG
ncbi:acetyl-CoA C-acyltransferase [Microbacter sp. GSS18]|nr:acetyl-CoA C-acyltransferase [Microbacter sp. GSS18]